MKSQRIASGPWLTGLLLVSFFLCGHALAQNASLTFNGQAKWEKRLGPPQRIASDLIRMEKEAEPLATSGKSGDSGTVVDTGASHIRHVGGLPEVEVCLNTTDEVLFEEARAFLLSLGMTVTQSYRAYGRIYGTLALTRLGELNRTPHLASVHPNYRPVCSAAPITTEGDAAMYTDTVRRVEGLDGAGVTVGVMSDSFNRAGLDLSGSIADGELPGPGNPGGYTTKVAVLADYTGDDATDEGRAMIEIVHDVAPGASLLFHTACRGKAAFAAAYAALKDQGADVIVDDVFYFDEAWFQDGIIAQAARQAVKDGILVFTCAGNLADHGIDAFFRDIAPDETDSPGEFGKDIHDFGGGMPCARVTIPAGRYLSANMQWNQPFDGLMGPGASTDLDLYLYDLDSLALLASSTDSQGASLGGGTCGGDPREGLFYRNASGGPVNAGLVVDWVCGPRENLRFKIICPGDYWNGYDKALFTASTAMGHYAAEDVITVGAVNYAETDAFNAQPLDPVAVERFTSLGEGTAYYFDQYGEPLPDAPVRVSKPELAAPDGGATTVPGFSPFYGTSAAAPHAAAHAALMLQGGAFTPLAVTDCMRAGAVDVGAKAWDGYAGNGLVHGPNTLALLEAGAEGVYAIEAGSGPHGAVSPSGRMIGYTPGTAVTLPAQDHRFTFTPEPYYHVADVLINGVSRGAMAGYTFSGVTEDQTLRVAFAPDTFTITAADSAGGTIRPSGAVTVTHAATQLFSIEADPGYTLTDVLVDGESVGALNTVSFSNPTGSHTLAAVFGLKSCTVTPFVTGSGTLSPPGPRTVDYGTGLSWLVTADAGHHIGEVLVNGEPAGGAGQVSYGLHISRVEADMTISIQFAEDSADEGPGSACFISSLGGLE